MYFEDRSDAGHQLAKLLTQYGGQNTAVIALSRGAISIGSEIAKKLHASLAIFAVEDSNSQEENPATALTSGGVFSYNTGFSLGDLEHDKDALRFFTDQRHLNEFLSLNHIAGRDGSIPREMLNRHNIILVSDGLENALSLQVAAQYLEPVQYKKLVLATPIASAEAIDKMHIMVDQIFCLNSVENFLGSDHYYKDNHIHDDLTVVEMIQKIVLNWSYDEPNPAANK
jgi:putative phosphoribosyl transferase